MTHNVWPRRFMGRIGGYDVPFKVTAYETTTGKQDGESKYERLPVI